MVRKFKLPDEIAKLPVSPLLARSNSATWFQEHVILDHEHAVEEENHPKFKLILVV